MKGEKKKKDLAVEMNFPMIVDNMNRRGSKDSGYGTISKLILANMIQPAAHSAGRSHSQFNPIGDHSDFTELASRWPPLRKVSFQHHAGLQTRMLYFGKRKINITLYGTNDIELRC